MRSLHPPATFAIPAFPATALLLVLFTAPACAQKANDSKENNSALQQDISDTVPLAAGGVVTIDNHEGRITVTTWDRDDVQYEAHVEPEPGADHPERTILSVDRSDQRLALRTEYKDGDGGGLFAWGGQNTMPVHYRVKMPRTARLSVDDHESKIDVTGLRAGLRIDTHEGPITVARQQGDVDIDSHESRIQLQGVTGRVTLDTHEGDITVNNLRGAFKMDTHEGHAEVTLAALDAGVRIDAHEGRFVLRLPAGTGFDLDTDFDEDADLSADFDLSALRTADEDEEEVNYRGAVNGGGPPVRLSSHEGQFRLHTR